jgi:hypothetical protein
VPPIEQGSSPISYWVKRKTARAMPKRGMLQNSAQSLQGIPFQQSATLRSLIENPRRDVDPLIRARVSQKFHENLLT